MTDLQSLILFILIGIGQIAILGDCYTTSEGLSYGETEGNPIARRLMKKFGQALTCWGGGALYIVASVLLGEFGAAWIGLTFAAAIAGVEIFNTVRNYRMYTATPNYKNKIRVPVVY